MHVTSQQPPFLARWRWPGQTAVDSLDSCTPLQGPHSAVLALLHLFSRSQSQCCKRHSTRPSFRAATLCGLRDLWPPPRTWRSHLPTATPLSVQLPEGPTGPGRRPTSPRPDPCHCHRPSAGLAGARPLLPSLEAAGSVSPASSLGSLSLRAIYSVSTSGATRWAVDGERHGDPRPLALMSCRFRLL